MLMTIMFVMMILFIYWILADKRNQRAAEEMRENAAPSIDDRMRLQVSKRYILYMVHQSVN
jgi:hypothetical protein